MRITIIAFGTRGDVQPTLALGKALKARGHEVSMLVSAGFAEWIAKNGIEAIPSTVDIHAMMSGEGGREWVEQGLKPIKQLRIVKDLVRQYGFDMMRDAWSASKGAEVVLSNFTSDVFAVSIAEKLRARHVSAPLQPFLRATRSGAATPQAPLPNHASIANYLFGKWIVEPLGWRLMGAINNRFRREVLALPPQTFNENRRALHGTCVVQGFSPHVVPRPPDWPPNIHTTGYWFLDEDVSWEPSQALLDFLSRRDPPVYVGFGSMTGRDAEGLTRTIVDGAARAGQRVVLQSGWAGMGGNRLPSHVFLLDAAPHSWLFPRVSAVVHHGGAGTTAEGLRAGKPTIIVPHMADQPFWGARAAALGVGPRPIRRDRLTTENLAKAISQAVEDRPMRERAAKLGERIRAERGIDRAMEAMEAYFEAKRW